MSLDTVQDAHLMHQVPLQLFEQHNPCYTSLLIFSAGLQASLSLLLHLVFIVYHHFSPVSPLPKSKVSSSPINITAFNEFYFLQWFQVKSFEKFLSPAVEGSSEKPTALQFFLPLLVWSPLEMEFSVNGMKKNPLIYYIEASVWYLLLNILCMKKSKTPNLQNSWKSLLKEYN